MVGIENMMKWVMILMMLVHSITDIKYKKVIGQLLFGGVCVGLLFWSFEIGNGMWENTRLFALCPGIFLLLLAKITREAIGYGDGWILVMLGFFYKWEELCGILMGAFLLATIVALFLLWVFRKQRTYEIPFVPFLTVALFMEELCG